MKNVWIVDDDRSIRWVLEKALQKADIPCKTFSEAESVLQAIKKEQPALILSDIHMPGKSGLEMLSEIKKSYPKLPIIIMTAYSDLDSAVASLNIFPNLSTSIKPSNSFGEQPKRTRKKSRLRQKKPLLKLSVRRRPCRKSSAPSDVCLKARQPFC